MDSADLIYDVCDEVMDEFKDRIINISDELSNSIIRKMKEKNILPYIDIPDQKSIRCSKSKLLIDQRIVSLIKSHFEFCFVCDISKKQLKDRMEVNSINNEDEKKRS